METEIPDKCPICRKGTRKLLLHIRKSDPCWQQIDKNQYEIWKKEINKRNKRNYQSKYVKDGRHNTTQKKFIKKCKKDDYSSSLQIQAQRRAKNKNREIIGKGTPGSENKEEQEKRMQTFQKMCCWSLYQLREGTICDSYGRYNYNLNKFHLIEADFNEHHHDELHAWMKGISSELLSKFITFQQIALVPRSRWKLAIEKAKKDPLKKKYEEKIYKIIGKLKSYNHELTTRITIPENYKSNCKGTNECPMKKGELIPGGQGSKKEGKKEIHLYKLSKEEEKLLISLIDDIIGCVDDFKDGVLIDLLQINKIMKNLEIALKYVAN